MQTRTEQGQRSEGPATGLCATLYWVIGYWTACLTLAISSGCQPADNAPPSDETPAATAPAPDSAKQLLRQSLATYAKHAHYQDQAYVRFEYELPNGKVAEETRIDLAFARPRLSLDIARDGNRLRLLRDEQFLWAMVEDPVTDNFQGQVVRRQAASPPSIEQLYGVTELLDPAQPQQMLSVLMGMPIGLQFSPIGFLLGNEQVNRLVDTAAEVIALAPKPFTTQAGAQVECERVAAKTQTGTFVFWIARDGGVIRRIEFPTQNLFTHLPADERPEQLQLYLDVPRVSMSASSPEALRWQLPRDSRLVQYFVLPPVPLISNRLGSKIEPMQFRHLVEGDTAREYDTSAAAGRNAVLLWFDENAPSIESVRRVSRVAQAQVKRRRTVEFLAVCAASPNVVSDAQLAQLQSDLGITVVRDESAAGRDQLGVVEAPTLVVLDAKQRLQAFEVGANPNLESALNQLLERLFAGDDVAKMMQHGAAIQQQAFVRQLNQARVNVATEGPTQVDVKLPSARGPKRATLKQAWQVTDIDQPGNLLVVGEDDDSRLAVLSGQRQIVLLDSEGGKSRPIALDLAEDEFVAQIRPALANSLAHSGRQEYVGFSQAGQFAYRFGPGFELLSRFPETNKRHTGITDAQLVDLDGDDKLELYVSFAPPLGCQRAPGDGNPGWNFRSRGGVSSIVGRPEVSPPHLLITGETGEVIPVSAAGGTGKPIDFGKRAVHQLVGANGARKRPSQFLGLSFTVEGRLIAIGLNPLLQESWSYGLPHGFYRFQVASPTWVRLTDVEQGHWLIAGPDGSIHIIQDDGRFHDSFRLGEHVAGVTGTRVAEGKGRIYVSTEKSVIAYDYQQP